MMLPRPANIPWASKWMERAMREVMKIELQQSEPLPLLRGELSRELVAKIEKDAVSRKQ